MFIHEEIKALGKHWQSFTDYDGGRVWIEPNDPAVHQRMEMLGELTHLREPIGPEWRYVMRFQTQPGGECCGTDIDPGDEYPDDDYDPMGDMMGRNE